MRTTSLGAYTMHASAAPLGIRSLPPLSIKAHRCLVLVLTFFCYATYHASRKAPSIVKSILSGSTENGPGQQSQDFTGSSPFHRPIWPNDKGRAAEDAEGWAPFNGPNGKALLGDLDLAFLGAYAVGMFLAGHLGDRLNLRHFLTLGMLSSAALTAAFGLGQAYQVHSIWYYVVVQVMAGFVQASGWPSVVAIMGNWYGKGKRGLIMGLWNAHTSVGNMLGSMVASAVLPYGWGYAFILPAAIMAAMAIIIALYLVVEPEDIGYGSPYEDSTSSDATPRSSISSLSENALRYLERHPHVRGRHPYAQLHAHSQLKRWGSSSSLSELSRASSGHPLNIPESPRSRFLSPGHFAHPIPASSRSALPCPSGLASPGNNGRPVVSLPQSFRQMSSVPQHAMLSSEPSSSLQGQGSSLQQPALLHLGHEHGTSGSKSGSWMQAFPNTSPTASGNPKQSHPVPEQASQGLADITNQAARSCASKTHAQSQIPHVDSSSRQQISAGRGSNTPQHMPQQPPQQGPQQYPQAGSTGDHHNILLASGHSHEPAAILRRPSPARDAVRQADEAASHAASTLQASLPSQDHAESQQQQQQQQRLQHSNLNLPRIVGLSSTLCLLDLPDSNRLQGTDGKLAWAAERAPVRNVSFWAACCIPGVATYAFTLFFCKLVAYTFLYWLPYYINSVTIASTKLSPQAAGNLSVLFDLGGVLGGSIAGFISDQTSASACTSCAFVIAAIPALFLYQSFGTVSLPMNIGLMMLAGLLVNGPYALITTAVSADLGTHHSLQGGGKALATVTAIIDGMGSCGAALGPVLTGHLVTLRGGFDNVFLMLYIAAAAAGLLLSKLAYKEIADHRRSVGAESPPGADPDILQRLLDDDQQLFGAMRRII